jgi:hypothetical protein
MGPRWLAWLGLLAASRSASALGEQGNWTLTFGGCTFSGNTAGAPLVHRWCGQAPAPRKVAV